MHIPWSECRRTNGTLAIQMRKFPTKILHVYWGFLIPRNAGDSQEDEAKLKQGLSGKERGRKQGNPSRSEEGKQGIKKSARYLQPFLGWIALRVCLPDSSVLGASTADRIVTPPMDFLSQDFCLQPGPRWKFLLRRTRSGQKLLPLRFQHFHSLSKGKQASLVSIHFSHPESDGKSADVGGGGRIGILITGYIANLQE